MRRSMVKLSLIHIYMELEDGKTYQVAISGISEKLPSETEVTDSGIVGMDAAKEFFGQFKTLSEADAEWK